MDVQAWFLLYSPLNQGLKPSSDKVSAKVFFVFLLYSPLNQGLKQTSGNIPTVLHPVFTLQSIKSRIETNCITQYPD